MLGYDAASAKLDEAQSVADAAGHNDPMGAVKVIDDALASNERAAKNIAALLRLRTSRVRRMTGVTVSSAKGLATADETLAGTRAEKDLLAYRKQHC